MSDIIVAIDGYSANGKSTTAKKVAKALSYIYVDSGAMYRAVTLYLLENSIDPNDNTAVIESLKNIEIDFQVDENGISQTLLNGDNVEKEIRTMRISNSVSQVSAIPEVRAEVVAMQREMGKQRGIVMDGRDIGSVVFPDAELKIFMTAQPEVRAQRRLLELQAKGVETSLDDVMKNLAQRDKMDTTRDVSPLRQVDDAVVLDNSNLTFDEQVEFIVSKARKLIDHAAI